MSALPRRSSRFAKARGKSRTPPRAVATRHRPAPDLAIPGRAFVLFVLKWCSVAFATSYALYLVALNLAFGLVHQVGLPEAVVVSYRSAWSFWPGQVRANDLRLVGTDSHVEWQLDIERVDFRWSPTALLQRRFHAWQVEATGVTMRMRMKLDAAFATPAVLALLPPIEGIAAAPIKPAVPSAPIPDDEYDLWSVRLDDVDAHEVREVWLDAYRFIGQAHLRGGFSLRPVRLAHVGPATIDVKRGELRVGRELAVEGLSGRVDGLVAPFDPREVHGAEALRLVSASSWLRGRVSSMRFVNHFVDGRHFDGGAGDGVLEAYVQSGVVAEPSHAELRLVRARLAAGEQRAIGSVVAAADVGRERLELRAAVADAEVTTTRERDAEAVLMLAPALTFYVASKELDLVRPFGDAWGSVDVPGVDIPDLSAWRPHVDKSGLLLLGGSVHARGSFRGSWPKRSGDGALSLEAERLTLGVATLRARGRARATIALEKVDLGAQNADLSGSEVDLREVMLSTDPKAAPWWGSVKLGAARLSWVHPERLQAAFSLRAKDGRPVLRELMPGVLADLIGLDGLSGRGTLAAGPSFVDVTGAHVQGGGWQVQGRFRQHGRSRHAMALATSRFMNVGLRLDDEASSVKLFVGDDWLRRMDR